MQNRSARTPAYLPLKETCFLYAYKVVDEIPRRIWGWIDLGKPCDLQPASNHQQLPRLRWKNKTPECAHVGGKEHGGCGLRLQFSLLSKAAMDPSLPRNDQFCQDIISKYRVFCPSKFVHLAKQFLMLL